MGPRERHMHSRSKTHIVPVVILTIFAFFLFAGVAFGVGMMGNVSRWLSDLPDYTDANQYLVSEPATLLDANGNQIASFYAQNRESVSKDQVSKYVLDGTVATEDERYYEHGGIDLVGIARAVMVQFTGGSEGASTITQQLVRNTILSEEQFDQTIERKVREAYLAIKMEEIYSKDEILMMYLNTIYYGHGAYGIEAAAKTYLGKNAKDLTLAESALLVGLPNAPGKYDPTINPDLAVQRRNTVLDRMLTNGYITQEEHDAAQAEQLQLNVTNNSDTGVNVYAYPYIIDYVKELLQQQFSYDMLFKGGLTIKTTIDPTIQAAAESAAADQMGKVNLSGLEVGMTVIDPKTGYIKAMVGGTDYNSSDAHTNYALSGRQVGSSFKAFTLATAISQGMNPKITVNASSPLTLDNGDKVQNYGNQSYGTITLAKATEISSNTAYVQVAEAIGNQTIIDQVKKMGIDIPTRDNVPVMTLGVTDLNTVQMAGAYAVFANGGYYREPTIISEIDSRDGKVLYSHEDKATQVLDTGVTNAVTDVLKGVITSGTGTAGRLSVNQPVAGKTGTTNDTTNLYFVGYTPQYSVAIWSGYNTPATIMYRGRQALGSDINLPIFKNLMNTILAGVPREEFPTGTKPTYKSNSSWKFKKSSNTKSESSSTSNDQDSTTSENSSETGASGTSSTTGNTSGTEGGTTSGGTGGLTGGTTGGGTTGGGTAGGGTESGTGGGTTGGGSTGGGTEGGTGGGGGGSEGGTTEGGTSGQSE